MKNTLPAVAGLAIVLHLAGCDREPASNPPRKTIAAKPIAPATPLPPSPIPRPAPGTAVHVGAVHAAARGAPEEVLQAWAKAMEDDDLDIARGYFGGGGAASGMSEEEFTRAWDKYRTIDITLGKGEIEGAAGSLYYEAPVSVTGLTRDGNPYHLSGTITARRVNDVPGATPEQLRWHIASTTLKP